MTEPLRVVFMGTPEFALPALKALHGSSHTVLRVITQPDRRQGRGRKPQPPPVKRLAESLGYPVDQPPDGVGRDPALVEALRSLAPDVFAVVAYGSLLPRRLLDLPRLGAVNIHPSLLPRYRGPAPIQWAVLNREPETGVTTMILDRGVDTGDILMRERTPLAPRETAESLHDRLAEMGAHLLVRTLDGLSRGSITPRPQSDEGACHAPRLTKADGRMDWRRSAADLDAFVRGMNPWPGAYTFAGDRMIKVYQAEPAVLDAPAGPGTVVPGFPDELRVAAGEGALSLLEVQGASGRRMPIADYLRGHALSPGTVLA